jgi:uncharacterized protein YqgC (DUF456 family)
MAHLVDVLQGIGLGLGYAAVALLCLAGIVLSCVSLSGTWLVVVAAVAAHFLNEAGLPGGWTLLLYVLISAALEVIEFFSGTWGVQKRGGSGAAGWMALLGGIAGLFLGVFIPIPIIGSLIGMTIGSFALVFAVEYRRLQHHGHAAHIAWGTVIARVLMILLKVGATLGMIAHLGFLLLFRA